MEGSMNSKDSLYREAIKKATQLAYDYESRYFGCSQATMAGLIEAFGIGGANLLRASTCLAGGIARRGHVCGALTAGLMMIGFLTGRDDLAMFDQYQRAMDYGNLLYAKFEEEFGTVSCPAIQELKFGRRYDLQSGEEREELHKRMAKTGQGCQGVTSAGARMAAEIIAEILESGPPFARIVI
jgi:C_GCAxxG_C_C family probable redox protein